MTRAHHAAAVWARDAGLRRVRKITWWAGLFAAAASAFVFARFAHIGPSLPRLPHLSDLGGLTSGLSSSSGVSSGTGGGQAVSGGS